MSSTRTRVFVTGRVQGVWFRESTRQRAEELGVGGWVRNLPDGRVEALFEGDPDAVKEAVDFVRVGPTHARVDQVDILEVVEAVEVGDAGEVTEEPSDGPNALFRVR